MEQKRKYIYLLSGTDRTLSNVTLGGMSFHVIDRNSTQNSSGILPDSQLYTELERLFHMQMNFAYTSHKDGEYIVFAQTDALDRRSEDVFTALRLYKNSYVGATGLIVLQQSGGMIFNHLPFLSTDPHQNEITLSFDQSDCCIIEHLCQKIGTNIQPHVKNMLNVFCDAFRLHNPYVAFLMRVVVLEMLIDGNSELTYRISRALAVFLGRDEAESIEIFKLFFFI